MSQTQYYPTQAPSASTTPVQYSQQMFGKAALFTTTHPNQQSQSSATVKSHSTAPSPQNVQIARYVIEDDNLDSLDVPDRPTSPLPFGNVHRLPVNLVGQPLPANFVVADTLWPIPPPAIQDEGRCKSRYLHESNSEACLQNIKDSKYWKEYKDDTIFVDISDEGEVIPLDEIQDSLMQRWTDPGGSNETRRVSRSQSRSVSGQKDNDALQSTIDEVERSLQAAKALLEKKERRLMANRRHGSSSQQIQSEQPSFVENAANQELETSPPSAALQKPIKPEKDTEEFLASLGVTGAPKPITETHWPSQRSEHGSPDDRYVSSSRRSSKADMYVLNHREMFRKYQSY